MIRLGTPYDIKALKQLWDESFNDPVNYIDFIFDKVSLPSDAMICDIDGQVVAMLLMIPTRFVYHSEVVNTLYILGACTHKKYRNRGYMTELIKQAEERAKGSGAGLSVLVPGGKYLFNYYKKRGYSADFRVRTVNLKRGMMASAPSPDTQLIIDKVSPTDLFKVRNQALADVPHISWSAKQMPFVMEDTLIYGGHIAAYSGALGNSYAFFSSDRRRLFVRECLGDSVDAQMALIKGILEKEVPRSVQINLPVNSPLFPHLGDIIPYGMAKTLYINTSFRDLDPYMNIMLD